MRLILLLLVAIVVVILLRAFRPTVSETPRTPAAPRRTRAEALEVLGLAEGASREDILAAYKKLIRKVHPDAPGGSGYLASKLNQAKQTLVG
jgi:preprotein translocase subunit Sec63